MKGEMVEEVSVLWRIKGGLPTEKTVFLKDLVEVLKPLLYLDLVLLEVTSAGKCRKT